MGDALNILGVSHSRLTRAPALDHAARCAYRGAQRHDNSFRGVCVLQVTLTPSAATIAQSMAFVDCRSKIRPARDKGHIVMHALPCEASVGCRAANLPRQAPNSNGQSNFL